MNEQTLFRLSLIFSVLGLAALFFLTRSIEINDTSVKKITQGQQGDVRVEGSVANIEVFEKFTVMRLRETSEVEVITFKSINLSEGSVIEITGYTDDDKIIAEKIKIKQ